MSRKARKSDRRVFSSKNRAAVSLVLLTWTVSFSCGQQISKEYPICSTGDSSCGQTHCSEGEARASLSLRAVVKAS